MREQPPRPLYRLPRSVFEESIARTEARPRPPTPAQQEDEIQKCQADVVYFVTTYCHIYDKVTKAWIKFALWAAQIDTLRAILAHKLLVLLKARQEGFSWLAMCFVLWCMLFDPIAQVILFSQRDEEAMDLIERLKGIYTRLPAWLKQRFPVLKDNDHEFVLTNESSVNALTGSAGGRSHPATLVVVDEADYVENLSVLIGAALPTIEDGAGKLVVLSTANLENPGSYFQRLYTSARDGIGRWKAVFFGWRAHPNRNDAWYQTVCEEALRTEGTLDRVYHEFPETDVQALQGRTLDKRFPSAWISAIYREAVAIQPPDAPVIPGLVIFKAPEPGHQYGIGADPAEGNPRSDPSAAHVLDADTYEQVAVLSGKIEPETFGDYVYQLSVYYHLAPILPERNNHGHLMIAYLKKVGATVRTGLDGKLGWLDLMRRSQTGVASGSKVKLFDTAVRMVQELAGNRIVDGEPVPIILHDYQTSSQLSQIQANTLAAPEGEHDDKAISWCLTVTCVYKGTPNMEILRHNLWSPAQPPPAMPGRPMQSARPLPPLDEAGIRAKLEARGIKRSRR